MVSGTCPDKTCGIGKTFRVELAQQVPTHEAGDVSHEQDRDHEQCEDPRAYSTEILQIRGQLRSLRESEEALLFRAAG